MIKWLSLSISIIVILGSCKKDQAELAEFNKNCSYAKEVSADFTIEEAGNSNRYSIDTDSIYAGRNVRFTALEENANYTWVLGAEILTEKSFVRFFPNNLAGEKISVSLKVEKTPNSICLPDDDGLDSLKRFFGIAPPFNFYHFYNTYQPKWEGTYRMLEEGTLDSVEIKMHLDDPFNGILYLENMNGQSDSIGFLHYSVKYNMLWNDHAQGVGCLDDGFVKRYYHNNTYEIYIPREEINFCEGRRTYHFKGRKL